MKHLFLLLLYSFPFSDSFERCDQIAQLGTCTKREIWVCLNVNLNPIDKTHKELAYQ